MKSNAAALTKQHEASASRWQAERAELLAANARLQ